MKPWRRLLSVMTAAALFCMAMPVSAAELTPGDGALPKDVVIGDANGDGKIDTTDARLILQHAVGKIQLDTVLLPQADADGNGEVDTTDARMVLQFAVGKITEFPEPETTFEIIPTNNGKPAISCRMIDGHLFYAVYHNTQLYLFENDQPTKRSVTWSSNNEAGISIDAAGCITILGDDKKAVITATLEDGRSFQQYVFSFPLGGLSPELTVQDITILYDGAIPDAFCDNFDILYEENLQLQFTAYVHYGDESGDFDYPGTVQWISSDPSIASVDNTGLVTVHRTGRILLQVTADNVSRYLYLVIHP